MKNNIEVLNLLHSLKEDSQGYEKMKKSELIQLVSSYLSNFSIIEDYVSSLSTPPIINLYEVSPYSPSNSSISSFNSSVSCTSSLAEIGKTIEDSLQLDKKHIETIDRLIYECESSLLKYSPLKKKKKQLNKENEKVLDERSEGDDKVLFSPNKLIDTYINEVMSNKNSSPFTSSLATSLNSTYKINKKLDFEDSSYQDNKNSSFPPTFSTTSTYQLESSFNFPSSIPIQATEMQAVEYFGDYKESSIVHEIIIESDGKFQENIIDKKYIEGNYDELKVNNEDLEENINSLYSLSFSPSPTKKSCLVLSPEESPFLKLITEENRQTNVNLFTSPTSPSSPSRYSPHLSSNFPEYSSSPQRFPTSSPPRSSFSQPFCGDNSCISFHSEDNTSVVENVKEFDHLFPNFLYSSTSSSSSKNILLEKIAQEYSEDLSTSPVMDQKLLAQLIQFKLNYASVSLERDELKLKLLKVQKIMKNLKKNVEIKEKNKKQNSMSSSSPSLTSTISSPSSSLSSFFSNLLNTSSSSTTTTTKKKSHAQQKSFNSPQKNNRGSPQKNSHTPQKNTLNKEKSRDRIFDGNNKTNFNKIPRPPNENKKKIIY